MIDDTVNEAQGKMQKSINAFKSELSKLRTGRAHPSLLEHLKVSYYGTDTPLSQVATIGVENARTLTVTPWEKNLVQDVEKAIMTSDLGLNPATSGMVIRVPLPALTEERRKDLTRVVRDEAEKARIAIRNIRRDANNDFKELLKAKDITEDDERRAEMSVQKVTDTSIADVDAIAAEKEKDLMAM